MEKHLMVRIYNFSTLNLAVHNQWASNGLYKVAWKHDAGRTYFFNVTKLGKTFRRSVVADSPETSVSTYYWNRCDIAENLNVHQHRWETPHLREYDIKVTTTGLEWPRGFQEVKVKVK